MAGVIGDGMTHGYGMIHGCGTAGDGTDHGVMAQIMDGAGILGDGMQVLDGDGMTLGDGMQVLDGDGTTGDGIIIIIMEIITEEALPITQAEEEVC